MKEGYDVCNSGIKEDFNYIVVANYSSMNEVWNYYCKDNFAIDEFCIGFWKIKNLK